MLSPTWSRVPAVCAAKGQLCQWGGHPSKTSVMLVEGAGEAAQVKGSEVHLWHGGVQVEGLSFRPAVRG